MTKSDLFDLLKQLNIPINEGEFSFDLGDKYPKIVYWEFLSEDDLASGKDYQERNTYQVSFQSRKPIKEDPKFKLLRNLLREKDIHPQFNFEYIADKKINHCFFSVEVVEGYNN